MYRSKAVAECLRRVRGGESMISVARSCGLSARTVRVWCADAGVKSRHCRRWTDAEVATLAEMWSRGMGTKEIAARLGRTRKSVERYVVKHRDVAPRRRQEYGGRRAEMGTNYYIRKKKPTVHETVHICKRSWGWRTSWQETTNDGTENGWPRWCDEDHSTDENGKYVTERTLPWEIHSVEDIRRYLRTGEWELIDEYGEVYPDWEKEIDGLVAWDGGKSGWNERNPDKPVFWEPKEHDVEAGDGYKDHEGNVMCRKGFC